MAGGGWKGAATVRECTVARSRAPKWPAWPFSMQGGRDQICLVALWCSKERGTLDALGGHWSEEGDLERERSYCPGR